MQTLVIFSACHARKDDGEEIRIWALNLRKSYEKREGNAE